ncbi:hypothetical protein GQ53DRAFT_638976 [Thozetella sp. PMI_491]|nr:hypothetical protein GQ53DRAFT_638976 [Thozetella sp. PMI_491]
MFEQAIPENLRQERALLDSTPANFTPPFPAYIARFPKSTKDLVMAVIGVQYQSAAMNDGQARQKIQSYLLSKSVNPDSTPRFQEAAAVTDNKGFYNLAVFAYWPSREAYENWSASSGFQKWWDTLKPEDAQHGWFLEIFYPSVDRVETVFSSSEVSEGSAHMKEALSGPILQHGYWGSMRDRLPISQTDGLIGEKYTTRVGSCDANSCDSKSLRERIRVPGKKNLTVIRSGQDWADTTAEERRLYLDTMHPVLVEGMNFLRDNGPEVGCYSCRFMGLVDVDGQVGRNRTFGLAYFDDIGSLESWSKQHRTHLRIFGGFLQYTKQLENNISLRLFHEVLVLKPEQQFFEYIACHEKSGMLAAL